MDYYEEIFDICIKNTADQMEFNICKNHVQFALELNKWSQMNINKSLHEYVAMLKANNMIKIPDRLALCSVEKKIGLHNDCNAIKLSFMFLEQLIDRIPHIKSSDEVFQVYEDLEKSGELPKLPESRILKALKYFMSLLTLMEPIFHPLIRKGQRSELISIIKNEAKLEYRRHIKSLMSIEMMRPPYNEIVKNLIEENTIFEDYRKACELVQLHKCFDMHIQLCKLLKPNSSVDQYIDDDRVVTNSYKELDYNLIRDSLEARIGILNKEHVHEKYSMWILQIVKESAELDKTLDQIKSEIFAEFPYLPDNNIIERDMEIRFYEALDKIKAKWPYDFPDFYAIEGILIYLKIRSTVKKEQILGATKYSCWTRKGERRLVWDKAIFYDHPIYRAAYEDTSVLIFL